MISTGLCAKRLKPLIVAALCLFALLTAGCGHEETPSAPGYYSGPMKGKTAATNTGGNRSQRSNTSASSQGS